MELEGIIFIHIAHHTLYTSSHIFAPPPTLCLTSYFMPHLLLYAPPPTLCPTSHFMSHPLLCPTLQFIPYLTFLPLLLLYAPPPTLCPTSHFMAHLSLYAPLSLYASPHSLCPTSCSMPNLPLYALFNTSCPILCLMPHLMLDAPPHMLCPTSHFLHLSSHFMPTLPSCPNYFYASPNYPLPLFFSESSSI